MRVLVCGGRNFCDRAFLYDTLGTLHDQHRFTTVIIGGAPGADKLAHHWAGVMGLSTEVYRADWDKYGPAAGPIRNGLMLANGHPELVVAFPGGKGTANMADLARRAGVRVIEVNG